MEQTKSDSKERKTFPKRKTFKNKSKKKKVPGEKRDSVISFRVSATQRQCIKDLADKCGMSLSGYVLSRASGYEPKPRLTPEQSSILDQLMLNRSDYVRYASMLNCMSQEQRRSLFRDNAWMRGALECLEKAAGRIMDIINRYFPSNKVLQPGKLETEKNDKTTDITTDKTTG